MKAIHQFKTFENILEQYIGDQPLSKFLASFFRKNKQMGSKDRKIASRLLYNFFRIGNLYENETVLNRLCIADFLCSTQINSFISFYQPSWESNITLQLEDKFTFLKSQFGDFQLADIFPLSSHLSQEIQHETFFKSFLIQPDLFIRVKRGEEKLVLKTFIDNQIVHKFLGERTVCLPNGTSLENVFSKRGVFEVQDLSSQKVTEFFKPQKWDKWWDCCAASGGKSLALVDEQPDIKLLVSDNRETILHNLEERFRESGVKNYQKKVLDLTLSAAPYLHDYLFDGIIFDAPCSGSGTWGRTPEMLSQFEEHKIKFFQELQRRIAANIITYLKVGKPLIYITCSVFKEENEEQVQWLCKQFKLDVEEQKLILGDKNKADTLFVCRLIKSA